MPEDTKQLKPHVIMPDYSDGSACFTMTRFAPVTDDFYFNYEGYLVVLNPFDVLWESPVVACSRKTLEEHILYIQENHINKALVIAEDISFLRQCPSLECLHIIPPYSAASFDYSPLYDMPNLKQLSCQTIYGHKDSLTADVDYSRISGLQHLTVSGAKGHHNIELVKELKTLYLGQGQPVSRSLTNLDVTSIEELDICQSPIRSLAGLESAKCLSKLSLSYCRQLEDVSALSSMRDSLTELDIEACGKIKDFSALAELHNLERLRLFGSNSLPNLDFLHGMTKLKSFHFTMNILDGDLSLCINIPYVYCRNKKHYNLKDCDLPKGSKCKSPKNC